MSAIAQSTSQTASYIQAFMRQEAAANSAMTGLLTQSFQDLNAVGSTIHRSTEKAGSMVVAAIEAQEQLQRDIAQRQSIDRATQASIEQIGQAVPKNVCSVAQSKEGTGRGLSGQGSTYRRVNQGGVSYSGGVKTRKDSFDRMKQQTIEQKTPEFVASPAGTMSEQQVQDQFEYILTLVSPTPPVNPKNLPAAMKGKDAAKTYESTYDMWEAAYKLYLKVVGRDIEMKTPTIAVDQAYVDKWQDISGRSEPTVVKTQSGATYSYYPDHREGLTRVDGKISEMDYIRTGVFSRYANPKWFGEDLTEMNTNQLLKEQLEMTAIQNRMIYELMYLAQSEATLNGIAGSRENNETFGATLNQLQNSMRQ